MAKTRSFDLVTSELIIANLEVTLSFLRVAESTSDPRRATEAKNKAIAEYHSALERLTDTLPTPHQKRRIDLLMQQASQHIDTSLQRGARDSRRRKSADRSVAAGE